MIIALTAEGFETFVKNVAESAEKGKDFLLPVVRPPRGLVNGAKCYVTCDGKTRGWVEYVGVLALDEHRQSVFGKKHPAGWYVVLHGPFVEMDHEVPMRKFSGFRYCGEL